MTRDELIAACVKASLNAADHYEAMDCGGYEVAERETLEMLEGDPRAFVEAVKPE